MVSSNNTVYLVTGANRGIGLGIVTSLISRDSTTVIATVRDESTNVESLKTLRKDLAPQSELLIVVLSNTDEEGVKTLLKKLADEKINHIDTVIANAGYGQSFQSALTTSLTDIRSDFEINTLSAIRLFQDSFALLSKASTPKFVFISSVLGSIEIMDGSPSLSYGMSKAAGDYAIRKIHFEHQKIVSLAIHPGWVQTSNGQAFADTLGVAQPPPTVAQSVEGILKQIDDATKETTSGKMVSYDGQIVPW